MNIFIFKLFLIFNCATGAFCQEIIVHPQNATVKEGGNITLPCEFRQAIDECVWVLHNIPVKIDGRYRYSDAKTNGRNTTNCSMSIKIFNAMDASDWQCFAAHGPRSKPGQKSKKAYLTIASMITVHPENATVVEGSFIVLQCKLNKPIVRCIWFRNGNAIKINDRYRYINSTVNGNNTSDCSIKISQFMKIDATRWRCSCSLSSDIKSDECNSNPAYLALRNSGPNTSTELSETTKPTSLENTIGLYVTNLLLYVLIGLLLLTITFLVVIYFFRIKKAKKKAKSDAALPLSTPTNNQWQHSSFSSLLQSSESLYTTCYHSKPEPFSSGGGKPLPNQEHMDKCLPSTPLDNDLPSYDETKKHQDDRMSNERTSEIFMSLEEIKQKYPSVKFRKMTSDSESVTRNPL